MNRVSSILVLFPKEFFTEVDFSINLINIYCYTINVFNTKKRGFSLIELLVVIAIIGILATVVIVTVNTAREKALIVKAKGEIKQIRNAIEALGIDTNQWPNHQNDYCTNTTGTNEVWDLNSEDAGITKNDSSPAYPRWAGPYMSNVPKDPWGNDYFLDTDYKIDINGDPYNSNPANCNSPETCTLVPVVGSFGPDGIGQNIYNTDDVITIITPDGC